MMKRLALTAAMACLGAGAAAQQGGADAAAAARAALAAEAAGDPENWREVDPARLIVFETTKGRILIEALPDAAPAHVEQFTAIVRSGKYDGTVFHRVIDGFMAQGGDIEAIDPEGSGFDDLEGEFVFRRDPAQTPLDLIGPETTSTEGYYLGFPVKTQSRFLAEMTKDGMVESWIPHCKGVVSTARTNDPNSANSQFFLMRDVTPHLDRQYTAWGRVIEGQRVVDALKTGEPVQNPDVLQRAVMAQDLPDGERPKAWVQRTDGPRFRSLMAGVGEAEVCALPAVAAAVEG